MATAWQVTLLCSLLCYCIMTQSDVKVNAYTVDSFGAVGNGKSDDTQAFLKAWNAACSQAGGVMAVPAGKQYLLRPVTFEGPCSGTTTIQVDGTINAPEAPSAWDSAQYKQNWIMFYRVAGLSIKGRGTFDGHGQQWWACRESKQCGQGPSALTLQNCNNAQINGITMLNSQQVHLNIEGSETVKISQITITAPEESPNTDGVHIGGSSGVTVSNSKIGTGDDCVSIVTGSSGIRVIGVDCGPGHGISIGSLGASGSTATVSDVVVDGCYLTGTTNGARIKTWQGAAGRASGIQFLNLVMKDVQNPILIDQFYCGSALSGTCSGTNSASSVKISDVTFSNIRGTSATEVGVLLQCSGSGGGCTGITLRDINLVQSNNAGPVEVQCSNVHGTANTAAMPSCFSSSSSSTSTYTSGSGSGSALVFFDD